MEGKEKKAIKQSLQEIATLLYYMYDYYLKDVKCGQSLDALIAFLGDLDLLGNSLTPFEAESVRSSVINDSNLSEKNTESITYEQFYSWLRGVSMVYYSTEEDNSRKALHMMLTNKIIPFSSTWNNFKYSRRSKNYLNGAILHGMSSQHIFLRLWFHQMTNKPTQKILDHNEVWPRVIKTNSSISVLSLMEQFEKIGLVPEKVDAQLIKSFATTLAAVHCADMTNDDDGNSSGSVDERKNLLSFADVVEVIGFMCSQVDTHAHRYLQYSSRTEYDLDEKYDIGWHVVLQTAAEYFLQVGVEKWLVYEFESNKYVTGAVTADLTEYSEIKSSANSTTKNRAVGMSPSSLLWICRQGGIIRNVSDIYSLYLHVLTASVQYSSKSQKAKSSLQIDSSSNSIVPSSKIPSLLSTLATHKDMQDAATKVKSGAKSNCVNGPGRRLSGSAIIYQADAYFQYAQALVGSSEFASEASIVAMTAPGILFASPQPLPSIIEALYSPQGARCVHLLSIPLQRIMSEIRLASHTASDGSSSEKSSSQLSFINLIRLYEISSISPKLIQNEILLKVASYVLGRESAMHISTLQSPEEFLLKERELVELIFAYSQVIFGGKTEAFSPPLDSVILKRRVSHTIDSEDSGPNEVWKWVIQSSDLNASISREDLQFAIADRVDRFYCLLELMDPNVMDKTIIERLELKQMLEKISKVQHRDEAKPLKQSDKSGMPPQTKLMEKLLSFLYTECAKWENITELSSSSDGGSQSLFFRSVVLLLFLVFPKVTSLSLTPWDVTDILNSSADSRHDNDYSEDSKNRFANLLLNIRFICGKYDISTEDFETFLSHLLLSPVVEPQRNGPVDYEFNAQKLLSFFPFLVDMFSFKNLNLLSGSYSLVLWDYLRCTRGNSGLTSCQQWYTAKQNDEDIDVTIFDDLKNKLPTKYRFSKPNPLLEDVTALFPSVDLCKARQEYSTITLNAAIGWALYKGIDSEVSEHCFQLCCDLSGNRVLHFPQFIIFCMLCYYRQGNSESTSGSIYFTMEDAADSWLEHVSKSVILHEKISTSESLVHAVMLDFSARACASVSDVLQISISLFHRLCSIGKRRCKIRGLSNGSVAQRLPPRPPLKLWDVPRFIGYCKTMGLLGYSGSFVATWKLFGPVLLATYPPAKTHGWSKDVVGPLPIEVSVEKVVELLEHFPVEAGCNPGDSIGCVIRQVIAPFLCGFFDDLIAWSMLESKCQFSDSDSFLRIYHDYSTILDAKEENSNFMSGNEAGAVCIDDSAMLLEDMLRYGGTRLMTSLELISPWINMTYEKLSPQVSTYSCRKNEPQSMDICRYISSSKLSSMSSLSMIVKQSMSCRSRDVEDQHSDACVSITEFEEILIRSAFALWCDVGGLDGVVVDSIANGKVQDAVSFIFNSMRSKCPSLSATVVGKYCDECRCSFSQSLLPRNFIPDKPTPESSFQLTFRTSSNKNQEGFRCWGIDYLTPFCALLQEESTLPSIGASKSKSDMSFQRGALQSPIPLASIKGMNDDGANSLPSPNKSLAISNDSTNGHVSQNKGGHKDEATQKQPKFEEMPRSGVLRINSESVLEKPAPKRCLMPPQRSSSMAPSPHAIVSRSEEMLAHILSLRGSTPLESNFSEAKDDHSVNKSDVLSESTNDAERKDDSQSTRGKQHSKRLEISTSPEVAASFTPTPFTISSASSSPCSSVANNDELLEGTKEALWPVFATYCSCGDSSEPGKLSGPNLFALLSKLDLLTDETMISDIGVLLHQISAHSLSQTPSSMNSNSNSLFQGSSESSQSPLLSFEEFIVFLCAFAQLRFEGVVKLPSWSVSPNKPSGDVTKKEDNWFAVCNTLYMSKSKSFKKLLEECVLPPLKKRLLLASPEDARHRDECILIFSLETLFSIESVEKKMLSLFKHDQRIMRRYLEKNKGTEEQIGFEDPIVASLARIKIIPQIVSEHEVVQLIEDILPSIHSKKPLTPLNKVPNMWVEMKFPQWQWVICIIAFKAVTFSIQKGQAEGRVKNLSSLVGEVITTMIAAMMA